MTATQFRNKFFGDKKFYQALFFLVIPIILQNGITNFVSLLDNIMVGLVGTEQMSGVAIVNQLMFIFQVGCFGAVSGAGIYGAQFYGKRDHKGHRDTFRYKIICCLGYCVICLLLFASFGETLVRYYLHDGTEGDLQLTLQCALDYWRWIFLGMLPFALVQVYASTLREKGETARPMIAGVIATIVNVFGNWLLIFGNWGLPALGVEGAAIATTLSRFVELAIIASWTHRHAKQNQFIVGAWRSLHIPVQLAKDITLRSIPLLANEIMWSAGLAMVSQCYSTRGLAAVAAVNIAVTLGNLFNVVFLSIGGAAAVLIGQDLGAGRIEKAKANATRLLVVTLIGCAIMGTLLFSTAHLFTNIYNTTDEVRALAGGLLHIAALFMPVAGFYNCCYFILRSGGDTLLVFFYDSFFTWAVNIPVAFCLSRFTVLPLLPLYFLCQMPELLKALIGAVLLHLGKWAKNLVNEK